jgi:8-oxo-dGTP diphosphatase
MQSAHMAAEAVPQAAVSGAIFRGDDVLLVQRGKAPSLGLWSLPGGHIEPGEQARDALLRELMEETGVTARLGGIADAVDVIRRDAEGTLTFHRVIIVFYGQWITGEPVAASDVSAAAWRHRSELAHLSATPGLQDVIARAWLRLRGDPAFHDGDSAQYGFLRRE